MTREQVLTIAFAVGLPSLLLGVALIGGRLGAVGRRRAERAFEGLLGVALAVVVIWLALNWRELFWPSWPSLIGYLLALSLVALAWIGRRRERRKTKW